MDRRRQSWGARPHAHDPPQTQRVQDHTSNLYHPCMPDARLGHTGHTHIHTHGVPLLPPPLYPPPRVSALPGSGGLTTRIPLSPVTENPATWKRHHFPGAFSIFHPKGRPAPHTRTHARARTHTHTHTHTRLPTCPGVVLGLARPEGLWPATPASRAISSPGPSGRPDLAPRPLPFSHPPAADSLCARQRRHGTWLE